MNVGKKSNNLKVVHNKTNTNPTKSCADLSCVTQDLADPAILTAPVIFLMISYILVMNLTWYNQIEDVWDVKLNKTVIISL